MKKIALITSVIIIITLIYLNLSLETNYITNDNTFRVEYKNINSITNNKKTHSFNYKNTPIYNSENTEYYSYNSSFNLNNINNINQSEYLFNEINVTNYDKNERKDIYNYIVIPFSNKSPFKDLGSLSQPFANSISSTRMFSNGNGNGNGNGGNNNGNGNGSNNNGNGNGPGNNNGNGHGHGLDGNEGNGLGNNNVPIGDIGSEIFIFILLYIFIKKRKLIKLNKSL